MDVAISEAELAEHRPVAVRLLHDHRSAATREAFFKAGQVALVAADDAVGLLRDGFAIRADAGADVSEPAEASPLRVPRQASPDLAGVDPEQLEAIRAERETRVRELREQHQQVRNGIDLAEKQAADRLAEGHSMKAAFAPLATVEQQERALKLALDQATRALGDVDDARLLARREAAARDAYDLSGQSRAEIEEAAGHLAALVTSLREVQSRVAAIDAANADGGLRAETFALFHLFQPLSQIADFLCAKLGEQRWAELELPAAGGPNSSLFWRGR